MLDLSVCLFLRYFIHNGTLNASIAISRATLRAERRKVKQLVITDQQRQEIFARYDGFKWYKLVDDEKWLVIFIEIYNQGHWNYNRLLVQCNDVTRYLGKQIGKHEMSISDWEFNAIIHNNDNRKYFTVKRTKFKIVNGKKCAKETQIIANKDELAKIIGQKRIEHLDKYETTLTYRNPYLHIAAEPPEINEFIKVSTTVSAVVVKKKERK